MGRWHARGRRCDSFSWGLVPASSSTVPPCRRKPAAAPWRQLQPPTTSPRICASQNWCSRASPSDHLQRLTLDLSVQVWVASRRVIGAAAAWQPLPAIVSPVPSEGMREQLRAAIASHTRDGASAACIVLPVEGSNGGSKTATGECLGAVQLGGRVTLLCEPGPPGQSKDDAARCVRAVARPKGGFPSEFGIQAKVD